MVRNQLGFTLVELLVVLIVMAILVVVAFGFPQDARERAADATARADLRTAMPAMEAYRAGSGTSSGMTLAAL